MSAGNPRLSQPARRARPLSLLLRAAMAGVLALAVAGCAVTPSVRFGHSTFEGFPVISYVPANPRGMVYLFHGSQGSADFAEKVETVAVLDRFIAQGYGFVSTSSTERTGDRRWDVFGASRTTNPDLARLARLHAQLVATTPIDATTPWGQTWKDAA